MDDFLPLGSLVTLLSGGTPSKGEPRYWTGPTPWVSGKDMKSFLLEDAQDHLSDEGVENGTKLAPAFATLLLVRGMSLHEEIRVCVAEREVAFNQDVKALIANPGVDPIFLAYALEGRHAELLELVDAASHGTGRILSEALESLIIWVPKLDEQRRIGKFLWTVDQRIRLNERMSTTLETASSAIFRSWFVDFDPVIAKTEGRKPFAMKPELASLFPTNFEDGVPFGWTKEPLSDLATLSKHQTSPQEAPTEIFEHYSIPAYDERKSPVHELGNAIQSNKFLVPKNSILVSKLNPENPRVWWPAGEIGSNSVCSTEFMVVQPKEGVPLSFLYCLFTDRSFRDELCGLITGTSNSHQRVQPDDLLRIRIARPSQELLDQFDRIVAPMFSRIHLNSDQNVTLRKLQAGLLSLLITGEFRLQSVKVLIT